MDFSRLFQMVFACFASLIVIGFASSNAHDFGQFATLRYAPAVPQPVAAGDAARRGASVRQRCRVEDTGVRRRHAAQECDAVLQWTLAFSPNSAHLACGVQRGDARFMMLDGEPGPAYSAILTAPVFTLAHDLTFFAQKGDSIVQVRRALVSR